MIFHQENSSYASIETFDYTKLSNNPYYMIHFFEFTVFYIVPRSLDGYTKITNRKYPSPRLRGSFCNGHGTTASVVSPFDRQFINFLPSSRVNNGIYRPISIDPPRPGEPIPIAIWNRLAPGPNRYHGGGTRRGYLSRAITINRPFVNRDSAARETPILGYRWEWLVASRNRDRCSAYPIITVRNCNRDASSTMKNWDGNLLKKYFETRVFFFISKYPNASVL